MSRHPITRIAVQETGAQHVRSLISSVHCARKGSRAIHSAAYVARACVAASTRGRSDGEHVERRKYEEAAHDFARLLYGRESWNWPKGATDINALLKIAKERLSQNALSVGAA